MLTRRRWLALALAAAFPRARAAALFPPPQLARIKEGLAHIYSLDHARAEAVFSDMIAGAPDDPAGYAYLAMTVWLRELADKQHLSIDRFAATDFFIEDPRRLDSVDPAVEARFRLLSGQAIERARRRPADNTTLFLLGLAYQNLATFEASLKRNWWAAFRNGARTYDYDRELLRRDPGLDDARLATGVYNYVAGSLGWSVRWLALLMGYRGSRERGKQDLEAAAARGELAADDARVILVLIYTRERDYPRAFAHLEALHKRRPRNYLVHLDMAGVALRMNQSARAIGIYQDVLRDHSGLERAAVYNRLGVACRAAGDLAASAEWLRRALAAQPSPRTAALAHLELGKTLDAMGRREEARAEYQAAAGAPDFAGSREEAVRLLRQSREVVPSDRPKKIK
jgi:tetratricopeptide (TPR) repeat protein